MPTNTTTPEAATTTTPAANTNTTPLSAMTGEEVASILVGLIRQNDGILIQQKVTDGINQSAYVTAYASLAADNEAGRNAIVAKMRAAGVDIPANATYVQLNEKLGEYVTLLQAGTKFHTGANVGDLATAMTNKFNLEEYRSDTLTSCNLFSETLASYPYLKRIILPNCTSFTYPNANSSGYIEEINLESLQVYSTINGGNTLIKANIKNQHAGTGSSAGEIADFYNTTNLIDLIIGAGISGNVKVGYNKRTNPTNAYDAQSSSLCFDTDTTEYATEMAREGRTTGFLNNREKWNFLLRQHFAYYLPDRSQEVAQGGTAYTISWNAACLAAMTQTTIDAFTAKGWILM